MTDDCDHYVVRRRGEFVCLSCHRRQVFTVRGREWVDPLTPSERGARGGRPRLP